jgi:hypothetical protein
MPASSRKRNKGKDRKAKQQAKKEESEKTDAHDFWRRFCGIIQCHHGCDSSIPDDHPVSSFMDQFIINAQNREMTVHQNLTNLFKSHRQIWNNESYRKLVLDILVRIGTNMYMSLKVTDASWPVCVAQAIIGLEHYNDTYDIFSIFNSRVVSSKWRDLSINSCERRDVLKFFRKRISCKCLKKMHLEARKTTPKMGICWHCKKEMERASLSVCSRCMVWQYCSRECQVNDWPTHKSNCDNYRRVHLQIDEQTNE